jgi:hypothetical protein
MLTRQHAGSPCLPALPMLTTPSIEQTATEMAQVLIAVAAADSSSHCDRTTVSNTAIINL